MYLLYEAVAVARAILVMELIFIIVFVGCTTYYLTLGFWVNMCEPLIERINAAQEQLFKRYTASASTVVTV